MLSTSSVQRAAGVSRSQARPMAAMARTAVVGWEQRSSSHASSSGSRQHSGPRRKVVTMMGNKATGGPFAPLVVVVRNAVGDKEFNKLRGKAISLHSQVIKDFCVRIGVDNKQAQGVIRLAKKNGEKLGFLA